MVRIGTGIRQEFMDGFMRDGAIEHVKKKNTRKIAPGC